MLRSTFHGLIPRISRERERRLWSDGVLTWESLEQEASPQHELFQKNVGLTSSIDELRRAFRALDGGFFSRALPRPDHYRIALSFPKKTLFLDIETTGLSRYYDCITLIGWSYRNRYETLVRGQDPSLLREALADALVVVTFNGSLFDLPFIKQEFPDLPIPPAHVDLRFLAKRVGLTGGQKILEDTLGFKRPSRVKEVKGETAPILWHRYKRGDISAMKLLIDYNFSDVEGMKYIFDQVVTRMGKRGSIPAQLANRAPRFSAFSRGNGAKSATPKVVRARSTVLAWQGSDRPEVTLSDLHRSSGLRVVGIDLTGSEKRPTGWCSLVDGHATTTMLSSNEEIVAKTLEAKPQLVSIDSPLSLPYGRTRVSDDDPARVEFGIMRICERILKKRGINVYPALIPSMQKLTARGIELARRFRSLGLPVIESYPGAAQDIMGIPRKRASLEMLRDGLLAFGVRGEFATLRVTHDELDAITSAVVGAFFWSGSFEALGTEEEEALIIPDINGDTQRRRPIQVIGLSGSLAAGKTTAGQILERHGYKYARYSLVLKRLLESVGRSTARSELQQFGAEVHEKYGQRWLNRRMIEDLIGAERIVVDGLRFPDDHAFLAEAYGPTFCHVHITSSSAKRSERFFVREDSTVGFVEADSHPIEQMVTGLNLLAHVVVENEDRLEDLEAALSKLKK